MSNEPDIASLLRSAGQKVTPQRLLILTALRDSHGHVTASQILEKVKASYPYVDASTVYRTLAAAKELRFVSETNLGSGDNLFEWIGAERHHHLICRSCGSVSLLEEKTSKASPEPWSARPASTPTWITCAISAPVRSAAQNRLLPERLIAALLFTFLKCALGLNRGAAWQQVRLQGKGGSAGNRPVSCPERLIALPSSMPEHRFGWPALAPVDRCIASRFRRPRSLPPVRRVALTKRPGAAVELGVAREARLPLLCHRCVVTFALGEVGEDEPALGCRTRRISARVALMRAAGMHSSV